MILNVLISTIDDGIDKIKVVLLPPRHDVFYIVAHQFTDEKYQTVPYELRRKDVLVSQIPGKGLTKSRNHAVSIATGDICLIADDDVKYAEDSFDIIIRTFQEKNPDVALFKIKTNEGEDEYKNYPQKEYRLNLKNFHSPSSIEIAFKTNKIKGCVRFDERFGKGSFLIGGEEFFFVRDSIKKNLNVWFYPLYIVNHPLESTDKFLSRFHKQKVRVEGAMDARKNGWIAIPKAFLGALKNCRILLKNKKNPIGYLYQRIIGVFYILKSNHIEKST